MKLKIPNNELGKNPQNNGNRLVRMDEACRILGGISRSTLHRLMKEDDDFPSRVVVSSGIRGFMRLDLLDYLNSKKVRN